MLEKLNFNKKYDMKIELQSDYVKAGVNIHQGDRVKLLDEGEYKNIKGSDGKSKKVLQFNLEFSSGEVKTYTMNVTTQKGLILAYGDDTSNWVGKSLEANLVKQLAFGKMLDVLVLLPTSGEVKMPSAEEIPVVEDEPKTKKK